MDLKITPEFEKFVRFCRKHGIASIKMGDFSMEMDRGGLFPESNYKKNKKVDLSASDLLAIENSYSDEDALYWSSAGIPDTKEAN